MADSGKISYTMAAEAAAEIVSQKLDILLSRPEWVGCFPVETLVKDAKANLALIQGFFSSKGRPAKSTEWAERLLRDLYDAEEFIDKFHLKVARGRQEALHAATRPLGTLVHKCMLWRDMSNLVKAMKELCQDQYLPDKKETGGETEKVPASAPWEGPKLARLTNFWDQQASTNFASREALKEEIVKRIRTEAEWKPKLVNVHGISIWGKEGTGKTFLARWIYREAMYLGFDTRAWVHLPAINDRRELLFEILTQVDKLARGAMDFNEIKEMLNQKLANANRFLIVLDDVRRSDEGLMQDLAMIIQPFSWRGHVITTTQDNWIADLSDEAKPIKLEILGEEERQKMLDMKLRRGPQGKDKILNQIPALPLCICLLGGLLSNATEEERAALANNNSAITASDLLELSYHRLPVHLKPCLIYMALFPLASPVPTRRLVRLWLAEGLLDSHCCNRGTEMTPEEVGETFILELADRNVIDVVSWRADGSPKACQMLTSLYDLICPAAISTGFLHIHNASKSRGKNELNPTSQQQPLPNAPPEKTKVRWLAEHTKIVSGGHDNSPLKLKLSQVRSFLSFYLRRGMLTKDISTFLGNMTSKADYSLLRVLDLEGVYKPSLQGMLRKLLLLRYLGLRSTVLDSIPSEVANLQYLETLDIKHTHITSLPSSLWKARNLRHLHLNWFYIDLKKILKACGDNVMALTKLQTLSGLVTGEAKENSMTGHMNSLTTLKLFLQHSDKDTPGAAGIADWISFKLTSLQSLTFGVIREAQPSKEATKEGEPAAQPADKKKEELAAQPADNKEGEPEAQTAAKKEGEPAPKQIGLLPGLDLSKHHELFELYLLGQLNKPIWTRLLPGLLRVLTLSGSNVKTDVMPELGALLRNLRTLRLLANSFLSETMSFAKDGFPSLKSLKIWKLPLLKKVTIEQGAMLHLKELEFRHLHAMISVEGINECKDLENICVTSQSKDLVNQLEGKLKGKLEKKQLHVQEVTKSPKSLDDKEGDGDEKGETFYLRVEKKSQSMNDDNSSKKRGDDLPEH
ncbi:hypothetical protein ACJRO7_005320 [Eucalyptus globulus]|uniref:NB-ARC domain-containing protein n=1 Tax=Eucalyptus globulus TaxID=34317 RepID=A0ABD3IZ74_EUCGL